MTLTHHHLFRLPLGLPFALALACGGEVGSGEPQASPDTPGEKGDAGVHAGHTDAGDNAAPDAGNGDATLPMPDPERHSVCSQDNVCWELPAPQGHTLHAAFAIADDDVWAVGEGGTIVHQDGNGFARHVVDTRVTLRGVHASAADNVWVVGDEGVALQYDGNSWTSHDVNAIVDASKGSLSGDLFGVFVAADDAVWIAGHSGVAGAVGFYDGETWHDASLEVDTAHALRAIWGSAEDDLWVVGDAGTIRRHDGVGWDRPTSPTGESLHAIHGAGPDEVWMVGDNATAVRWDGKQLIAESAGLAGHLRAVVVDGLPPEQPVPQPLVPPASDAGASPAEPRVWVLGEAGRIFRWNDLSWLPFASGSQQDLLAATRLARGELLAVGQDGLTQHYRGDERATLSYGSTRSRLGLFGMPNGDLWSVGDEVLRAQMDGWQMIESARSRSLFGAWGDAQGLWAVGTAGTVLRFAQDGVHDESPTRLADKWLRSIWGAGQALWLVGHDGTAAYRDEGEWKRAEVASGIDLMDVWGLSDDDMWIVGDEATALHYNGARWVALPIADRIDPDASLRAVWGPSTDDVWTVGSLGTIARWNGSVWEATPSAGSFTLNDVWGPSPDEVYAVGTGGTLLHFDGEDWKPLASGTDRDLHALGPGPDGHVRIAGQHGTLLVIR